MNTDKISLENESQPSCLGAVSGSVFNLTNEITFNNITYIQHIGFDGLLFYCKQIKK